MVCKTLRPERVGSCLLVHLVTPEDETPSRLDLSFEMADVCSELAWDDDIRVVVLSFGGNCVPAAAEPDEPVGVPAPSFVETVARVAKPVIAAVHGDAVGTALELAMACDLRIGTRGGRFGLHQVSLGGIPADGGTQRLLRLVGQARALEMVLLGREIDAEEAERIGLLHRVVAPADLPAAALALAQDLALKSPVAVAALKETIYRGLDLTLDQGLRLELDLYLLLFSTEDRIEGITAFREKRTPEFSGK